MILIVAIVLVLFIVVMIAVLKKGKQLEQVRQEYEQYKSQIQSQLSDLQTQKTTLEVQLTHQERRFDEYREDAKLRLEESKQDLNDLRQENSKNMSELRNYHAEISELKTKLTEQTKTNQEKLELLQNSEAKLKTEFENLANKIFEDNSKKLNDRNQESLNSVLNPVRDQLKDFRTRVDTIYSNDSKDRTELKQELKTLKELNQKMSEEAHNLTTALKGDKKQQGTWGEMILEKVLENSGLKKDVEYIRELSLKDEHDQVFRPDVVVKLPDNRDIVVDAKTSLVAYDNYISANTEDQKTRYLNEHILALKSHIDGLSIKEYEKLQGVNSLDFIFIFVPIENALNLALTKNIPRLDSNLYDYAFKKKIVLVSPTTLLLALRVVENTWKYEHQARNIVDVYARAEELYKKFVGFIEDLEKVGKSLVDANKSYEGAFSKLKSGRGNLIGQVEKLKKVSNIKSKKEISKTLIDEIS